MVDMIIGLPPCRWQSSWCKAEAQPQQEINHQGQEGGHQQRLSVGHTEAIAEGCCLSEMEQRRTKNQHDRQLHAPPPRSDPFLLERLRSC